jgi:hypothetical protein
MKNTLQDNAAAGFASKQRSISYIPEVSSLKRFALMLLLTIALPTIGFADSSSAKSPQASANSLQTKSNAGIAESAPLASLPEPGTLCLVGTALLGLAVLTRRKLKAKESLNASLVESSGD